MFVPSTSVWLVLESVKEKEEMKGRTQFFTLLLLMLSFGMASHAAMVVETPGYGTDVIIRGSGALPGGYVEVFVNNVSKGSVLVNAEGEWHMDGMSLATGDKVYATLSKVWNFSTNGDTEGWTPDGGSETSPGPNCSLDVSSGTLKMTINSNWDPFMYNSSFSLAHPGQYRNLQMRVKNGTGQGAFQVFFDGSGNAKGPGTPGNDKTSIWPTTMSDFQTINFDLGYINDSSWGNNSNWVADAPITHLRIDTFNGSDADVGQVIEFDWIRLTEYISFEFDTDDDFDTLQATTANDMTNITVANGCLNFTAADTNSDTFVDPYIVAGSVDFQFDANYYSKLEVGGKFTSANTANAIEFFWSDNILSGTLQGWAENGNLVQTSVKADGTYQQVLTDLLFATTPGTPTWGGSHSPTWYNSLRFDFLQNTAAGDTFAIDYISLQPNTVYGPSPVVATSSTAGEPTPRYMVQNGSFEDSVAPGYPGYIAEGGIPSWHNIQTGGGGSYGLNTSAGPFHDSGDIYNGDNICFLQHAGILYQDVDGFVAGKTYTLRYRENTRGYTGSVNPQLEARVNGVVVDPVHEVVRGSYVLHEVNFTSPGTGMYTLEFEFYENEADQTMLFETISIVLQGAADPWPKNPDEPVEPTEDIVTNGGFEEGTMNETFPHYGAISGWDGGSGVNDSTGPFHDNGSIPEGKRIGFKQGDGIVSQTVELAAGTQYTLRFRENSRAGTAPIDLEVRLNGTVLVEYHTVYSGEYILVSKDFSSPGTGNYLLEFQTYSNGLDATLLLDTVSITLKGAEEPFDFGPNTLAWPVNCYKLNTPPTIDGNIDVATEYPNAQVLDLRVSTLTITDPYFPDSVHEGSAMVNNASSSLDNDGDLSGLFYFGWDANALYVAVNVRDEYLDAQTAGSISTGDCVVLGLDYDQIDSEDVRVDEEAKAFGPSYSPVTNTNNAAYFEQGLPPSSYNPMTGTTWAVVTTSMGYRLETRIPWTAFTAGGATFTHPFPPVDGQTMGMLPLLVDSDSDTAMLGLTSMFTCGDDTFVIYNPIYYQDMIFLEGPTAVDDWAQY